LRVGALENAMVKLQRQHDDLYIKFLNQEGYINGIVRRVDKVFVDFYAQQANLANWPEARRRLGLGCFTKDTMIQVEKSGKCVPVSQVSKGSYVWNPVLGKKVLVSLWTLGREDGFIYLVETSDGSSVEVTETHPMIVYDNGNWMNIPARDLKVGHVTLNLVDQENLSLVISSVTKIPFHGKVYNFALDLPESSPILSRVVIANGVPTLDFIAQKLHN